MTDFLQRVSLMARGQPPSIRPLVASRYAPDAQLLAPELRPDEPRPFESPVEHAPHTAAQTLSPSRPSLNAEPTRRRATEPTSASTERSATEQTVAHDAGQENAQTPPSQASSTTMAAKPADDSIAPHTTRAAARAAMPLDEPPPPTRVLPATDAFIEPEQNAVTWPEEEARAHASPTAEAAQAWPSPTAHAESRPPPEAERLATASVDVRVAPPRRPDAADERAALHKEADTFSTNDNAPPAHGSERGAQARPGSGAETTGRGRAAVDAFTPGTGSEREVEAHELSAPRPRWDGEANSFGQADSRRVGAQSLSSWNERPADAPSDGVIRVTIGRIEVRAVTQPPPLQSVEAAAPPAPKLSLDEYLRQHNGRPQ